MYRNLNSYLECCFNTTYKQSQHYAHIPSHLEECLTYPAIAEVEELHPNHTSTYLQKQVHVIIHVHAQYNVHVHTHITTNKSYMLEIITSIP